MRSATHLERVWRRLKNEVVGQDIAEAALVLPLLFTIFLGIFWLGRAYNVYTTIHQAAKAGAVAMATETCGSCAPINFSTQAATVATANVQPVLSANNLDPTQVAPPAVPPNLCPCGTSACGTPVQCDPSGTAAVPAICVQENVDMGPGPNYNPPSCGMAVSFTYPFNLPLPFAPSSLQNFLIHAEVKTRIEQ